MMKTSFSPIISTFVSIASFQFSKTNFDSFCEYDASLSAEIARSKANVVKIISSAMVSNCTYHVMQLFITKGSK